MKKLFLLLFTLSIFSTPIFSQTLSVGFSPYSIEAWGNTPYTSSLKAEYTDDIYTYKKFQISIGGKFQSIINKRKIFYTKRKTITKEVFIDNEWVQETYTTTYDINKKYFVENTFNSLFFVTNFLLNISDKINISQTYGIGYFQQKFPDSINGTNINFSISQNLSYELNNFLSIGIEYNHISNANTGNINIGIDNMFGNIIFDF